MKRSKMDYEDFGSSKRQRQEGDEKDFELRFLIPGLCAGTLIGKGGERITAIRKKFNKTEARIHGKLDERVVVITAPLDYLNQLVECFDELVAILSDDRKLTKADGEMEIRLLIHQSIVGAIIGHKGEKITELRKQTKAHVSIYSDCLPNSTDRVLQITSQKDGIVETVKKLVDQIKDVSIKGPVQKYDPDFRNQMHSEPVYDRPFNTELPRQEHHLYSDPYAPSPLSAGTYNDLTNLRMPPTVNPNVRMNRGVDPPPSNFGQSSVNPLRLPNYRNAPNPHFDQYSRFSYATSGNPSSYSESVTRDSSLSQSNRGRGDSKSTFEPSYGMLVSNELIGSVIGKGGEIIKRIRQETGAEITIESDSHDLLNRKIYIGGTPNQVEAARGELERRIRKADIRRRSEAQGN